MVTSFQSINVFQLFLAKGQKLFFLHMYYFKACLTFYIHNIRPQFCHDQNIPSAQQPRLNEANYPNNTLQQQFGLSKSPSRPRCYLYCWLEFQRMHKSQRWTYVAASLGEKVRVTVSLYFLFSSSIPIQHELCLPASPSCAGPGNWSWVPDAFTLPEGSVIHVRSGWKLLSTYCQQS